VVKNNFLGFPVRGIDKSILDNPHKTTSIKTTITETKALI
jgi:hypothetical protein